MTDDGSLRLPGPAPSVGGRPGAPGGRDRRRRRTPGGALPPPGPAEDEADEFPPTPVPGPDPNQPLLDALDRELAVDPPAASETTRRIRAVRAYQEASSRWFPRQDPGQEGGG